MHLASKTIKYFLNLVRQSKNNDTKNYAPSDQYEIFGLGFSKTECTHFIGSDPDAKTVYGNFFKY